ncbi:MAG TPA: DUF6544 family protein [Polyangiaceae bacterium]|nr:DUF6544 family protein [Polyangiaceae bacterium]
MRILAALFLLFHGIAHLFGFRAAFWASAPQAAGLLGLGQSGTRALGIAWLLLAVGFMATAALLLVRSPAWSSVTLTLTVLSAILCVLYLPEARIGLILDIVLLVAVLWASRASSEHLWAAFARELRGANLPKAAAAAAVIDERAIASLPEPVQRYLRFMGVLGRPRDWSLRARFVARFRRGSGDWLACEALQYDTRLQLSRVFCMQLALGKVLPVTVRDTYVRGRGTMLAKAFDYFRVVEGTGHELDVGELVTYLNDAILMAPSLLLGPETSWKEVGRDSFDVTLTDGKLSVTARVWLDERGAPTDFSTTDRFYDMPDGKRVRTEWRTPISGWQDAAGRKLPTRARAVWQLPTGEFPYADFSIDPAQVAFNVPPDLRGLQPGSDS